MPTKKNQEKDKDVQTKNTESLEEKIVIPGFTDKGKDKENVPKKPLIMEMEPEKYTPNFKINRFNENGQDKIQYVFDVPEEKSAKDIDMDIRFNEIKLNSKK